ncbi:MAG: UDP-N-acetylglucosamine 2-epimerase (non-hydrolyzing) [Deltaproteobacteria bacterium]|nr:UDP-N-acetylglucosamine 2-epimerase (non-hydrolyzing) [Deltaproteobacteria bacterium]
MKKILLIFGTRPEAIKMAPVVLRLKAAGDAFQTRVAVTAQHRQMLDQVLDIFNIQPDHDLDIMSPNQDLFDIASRGLTGLKEVLRKEEPDLVLVHGDTTTTFIAALAAFFLKIPVGHVEAGLRTKDKYQPFPEEMNRHLAGVLTDYHFAPTPWARDNLVNEGVAPARVWVTGNTVIDALKIVADRVKREKGRWEDYFRREYGLDLNNQRLILVTGHRRENFGPGFENICWALRDVVDHFPGVLVVYPVHLNPNVQRPVYEILSTHRGGGQAKAHLLETGSDSRLFLLPPLEYVPFVYLLSQSYLVLTDSGGIQEEAPALGKPVLVMREVTERPEGLWARTVKLVGTDRQRIFAEIKELLDNPASYRAMAQAQNPYGDGQAAARIVQVLAQLFAGHAPDAAVIDPWEPKFEAVISE